jgi:phosphate transport system protein
MSRTSFGQEMQKVKNEILLLASMVEEAVMESARAPKENDLDRSRRVIQSDLRIKRKRFEIEISIIVLMATQQPAARDLRRLAAHLGICSELERMGDYAKGIANINIRSEGLSLPRILKDVYSMAEKAADMLHRAMTSFADEDLRTAKDIIEEDDMIDECYSRLYHEAVHNVLGDPRNIESANYVIGVAYHLERLGDRVTNICEGVIYIITGDRPELSPGLEELKLSYHEN